MAAGAGYYDANGIYHYGETDNIGLFSDMLNIGMQSTSDSITNLTSGILTAWTAYTPTVGNFTVGNGVTNAFYKKIGKTVHVRYRFITGSTTTFTGTPVVSLPVQMKLASFLNGSASLTNGNGIWVFVPNTQDTVNCALYAMGVGGTFASYSGWVGSLSTSAGAALEFNMTYESI